MDEIKLLKEAYKIYNLDNREDISNKILDYISVRIIANRSSIEQMIEMLKLDITFNDILDTFNSAYKEKEYYKEISNYTQGVDYYSGIYPVSIGNIVIETNDLLEVIKYFVLGIKSRNTITISQTEYEELSLSNMFLIIFVEALAKFNISRNTLMILPYEDCFYDEFDEVIVLEDGKIEIKQKEFSKKYIIYAEDEFFKNEIIEEVKKLKEKDIAYELISGDIEIVLDLIYKEKPETTVVYTKNPKIAYEFINLANSQNVFVNTSSLNSEQLNDKKNKLYYKKKIMYPSGKTFNFEKYINYYDGENEEDTKKENQKISNNNSNMYLKEIVNPWYKKIFKKIKEIFFKK